MIVQWFSTEVFLIGVCDKALTRLKIAESENDIFGIAVHTL